MADTHSFKVAVVTPSGEVFTYPNATLVVLHTTDGELGLMANHNPVISALTTSEMKIENQAEDYVERLAINGGFTEFSDNTLTVVADAAEKAEEIDVNRAERARDRAKRRLQEAQDQREQQLAEAALSRAITRIHAASNK
ncbi:F-type H+-transporting ATPase subunit epsilon [Weissella uvarum]|uniref:F0F1 ATP synthase subunit epsilon n=1 Tax=Weissella uvarum TaxID=1479233 RepID=UPI00195FB4D9|nr:F0F1 ATP synthase subunit epsilon [Weissella uvarum]MBM7616818.1 F-type H+-transporting ATPase subunit epsilon [Weissella uvarum]MCM0594730.1 F0F1 ATP synthase subunit epsilon [Weissella uvarum]